jgi:hypothetical protein
MIQHGPPSEWDLPVTMPSEELPAHATTMPNDATDMTMRPLNFNRLILKRLRNGHFTSETETAVRWLQTRNRHMDPKFVSKFHWGL